MTVKSKHRMKSETAVAQHMRTVGVLLGLSAVLMIVPLTLNLSSEPSLAWNEASPQAEAGTIRILPSPATTGVGEAITVEVWIEDVANYYGLDFRLSFDPAVANIPSEQVTPLWEVLDPGNHLIMKNQAHNVNGTVWYAVTNLRPAEPFTGTGRICSITFAGLAPGTTTVDFFYAKGSTRNGDALYPAQMNGEIVVEGAGPSPDPLPYPVHLPFVSHYSSGANADRNHPNADRNHP